MTIDDIVGRSIPYLFSGLLAAIVAGIVAVRLLPKQFYKQQWWQRKIQAYIDGLDALAKLHHYARERLIAYEAHAQRPPDVDAGGARGTIDLKVEDRRQARKTLKSIEASGGFLVSDEAAAILATMFRTTDFDEDLGHPYPELERDLAAVEKALVDFRNAAKRDLAGDMHSALDFFLEDHRRAMAPQD